MSRRYKVTEVREVTVRADGPRDAILLAAMAFNGDELPKDKDGNSILSSAPRSTHIEADEDY